MEKDQMKTAHDVIMDFQKLSPDQQDKVRKFVNSVKEQDEANSLNRAFEQEYVEEENYSPEDMALILQASEYAKRGINMSGPFNTTKEIFAHLDSLKPE
jgi:hypothetical protein